MKNVGTLLILLQIFSNFSVAQVSMPPNEDELHIYLPLLGNYGPNPRIGHFAGETFRFDGKRFHYRYFTDVADDKRPEVVTGIDGGVRYFPSYVELSFPDGKRIYFIRSRMLNQTVLIPWPEYQKWKRDGRMDENELLYQEFQKYEKSLPKH